jgi:hypothetical protein
MAFWDGTRWTPEVAEQTARPRRTRPSGVLSLSLVAALMLLLPLQGVFAASSSVWVLQLAGASGTVPTTASLHYNDAFNVGYKSQERQPWAHATCYANSSSILTGAAAADGSIWGSWYSLWSDGPSPQNFVLGASVSPVWTGGGADCTVDLVKVSGKYLGASGFSNQTVLAQTRFTVAP